MKLYDYLDQKEHDDQRQSLQIAQKHAAELGRLIDHFFEYSYLLHTEPELNIVRINLTNFIAESLAASVSIFEENGLSVRFEEKSPVFVLADQDLLRRIIQNLLRNSVQHAAGDLDVRIEGRGKDRVALLFSNPVHAPHNLDASRLFDRFYTGDKARSGRSGLGLSIVQMLAEQMGGRTDAAVKGGMVQIRVELPNG